MSEDILQTEGAPTAILNATSATASSAPKHANVDTAELHAAREMHNISTVRNRGLPDMDPLDLSTDIAKTRRRSTGSSDMRSQCAADLPNLPNLRDLALSSGLAPRMRRGLLFRSARHFATTVEALKATLCDCLDIRTLIDLRSRDLGSGSEEEMSRRLAEELFAMQPSRGASGGRSPRSRRGSRSALGTVAEQSHDHHRSLGPVLLTPPSSPDSTNPLLGSRRHSSLAVFPTGSSSPSTPPQAIIPSMIAGETSRRCAGDLAHVPRYQLGDLDRKRVVPVPHERDCRQAASSESAGLAHSFRVMNQCDRVPLKCQSLPAGEAAALHTLKPTERGRRVSIALNPLPACSSPTPPPLSPKSSALSKRRFSTFETDKLPINEIRLAQYPNEKKFRKLFLVDILDTPQAKKKINEAVMGSFAMPIIAACRLADKISGSTLAPFFFCKFLLSTQNLIDSYKDMLSYCGKSFSNCLKVICTAPSPTLFHCTLGKDRTGLVAMLVLSVLGASDQAIAYDFSLTDHGSPEYLRFRHHFIVEQSGLAEKFERAPTTVILETLSFIRDNWGSVDNYLDKIGFGPEWREHMQRKFLVPEKKRVDAEHNIVHTGDGYSSSSNQPAGARDGALRPHCTVRRVAFTDEEPSQRDSMQLNDGGSTND